MPAEVTPRCVIYARVSSKDQSNWSLETQAERCLAYAAQQGWLVDEVFIEDGKSATTTERPELLRMLAHLKANRRRIQFVVVYALNRFARNTLDHLKLRRDFTQMGILLRSATEHVDESPTGELKETLDAAVAQHYSRALSVRVTAGMRAAIQRGRWPWKAAVGYRNARDAAGRPTYEPDPLRAPLIRQAFEMAADGRAPEEILRHVRAHGLTTKKGNAVDAKALAKILRNPVYAGILRAARLGSEGTAAFVPIVEPSLFHRAQAALRRRAAAPTPQRNNPEFPLKGFVRCACGRPLVGYYANGRGGRYPYYECQACNVREKRDRLEAAFVEMVNDVTPPREILEAWRIEVLDVLQEQERSAGDEAANLMRRAASLRERKKRLAEAYVIERAMQRDVYDGLVSEADAELSGVEGALAEAQAERLDAAGLLDYALRVITRAGELWLGSNLEQRLGIQEMLFLDGLTWSRAKGFHRTTLTCLDSWVSNDSDVQGDRLVEQTSATSNLLPFLRMAEKLRKILPIAA